MNYSLIAVIVIVVILSAYFMSGSKTQPASGNMAGELPSVTSEGMAAESGGCVNGVCSLPQKKKKVKTD